MSKSNKEFVRRGKHLSLVLRHDPASINITLDSAGWTDVAKLLTAMHMSAEELDSLVDTNDKKRFEFRENKSQIRACQGHSVDVELELVEREPPDILYHGTSRDYLDSIFKDGLKPMKRHAVHLSDSFEKAFVVAKRRPNPVILSVASNLMFDDGCKFYLSTNGVWLTDIVEPRYLEGCG